MEVSAEVWELVMFQVLVVKSSHALLALSRRKLQLMK